MTSSTEIAKKLLDQQAEINMLRKKLARIKGYVATYAGISGSKELYDFSLNLAAGINDIIDNAYEEDK